MKFDGPGFLFLNCRFGVDSEGVVVCGHKDVAELEREYKKLCFRHFQIKIC